MPVVECPICKNEANRITDTDSKMFFYECPICGRYELSITDETSKFDLNHLSSYLVYHEYEQKKATEYRYNTILSKEECDRYGEEFKKGNNVRAIPVHMNPEMVEAWYPHTFAERVDLILLYINSRAKHIGQKIEIRLQKMVRIVFVDMYDIDEEKYYTLKNNAKERDKDDWEPEVRYILDYLKETNLIDYAPGGVDGLSVYIKLTPEGYKRVDELQKNTSYGKGVLVAMKFGDETKALREAIRKGITDAGYIATFIDEVQHNEFITPELLKHIKDSKFVVVDLTHMNNGAYFEEGYAMGLGKEVIQLCQKDTKLHFDIAQKNTIMWDKEEDIPVMLTNRINATIN